VGHRFKPKESLACDLLIIPLTVPVAAIITYLLMVSGIEPLFAYTARYTWPMRDVLPVYIIEIPLLLAIVLKKRGTLARPRFLAGLVIWLCANVLFYLFVGGLHP